MKDFFYSPRGVYYRVNEFKPERQTLVFIHGLSGSSSAWKRYEEKFSATHNILSFDLRGNGRSSKPSAYTDYTIQKFAEDIAELLEHLEIENCIIVSHSLGTLIAFEFLACHPENVRAMVLLAPSFSVSDRLVARLLKPLFNAGRLLGLLPFSSTPGMHVDYARYQNTGDWNLRRMYADITNTSLHVYLYGTLQSYAVNYEKLLDTITVPTLIIHGKRDTIFPVENSISIATKIKGSELAILDDANHIIVLNNFPEVSRALENFLHRV